MYVKKWCAYVRCLYILGTHLQTFFWLDLGHRAAAASSLFGCWIQSNIFFQNNHNYVSDHCCYQVCVYRSRDAKHQSMLCRTEDYCFGVVQINMQLGHGLAEKHYPHKFTQKAKYLLQRIIGIPLCFQFLSNNENQPHSVLAKSARALTWSFIVDLKPFTMNKTATLHSCSS